MKNTISNKEIKKLVLDYPYDNEGQSLSEYLESKGYKLSKRDITNVSIKGNFTNKARCRFCNELALKEDAVISVGYWYPNAYHISHKDCIKEGERKMQYECQKIDADCNDCANYVRVDKFCVRYSKKVKAVAGFPSLYDCFSHRLDAKV
jgi:hypothetical protein